MGFFLVGFMPPAFHPEVHRKFACDASDHERYDCDVSFIGTWSPKKQALLEARSIEDRAKTLMTLLQMGMFESGGKPDGPPQ